MKNQNRKQNNKGAAMLIVVMFSLFASMTVVMGVVLPVLKQAETSKNVFQSKESFYIANSGVEDVFYRLKGGMDVGDTEVLVLNNSTTTTFTTNTATGKQIVSTSDAYDNMRKVEANVILGEGAAFNYGIQTGLGGFILENSASVTGNVYSSGSIIGSGNTIDGDAVSAGPSGFIDDMRTTGSAYANTIEDSHVSGNAYYVTKTRTTVIGTSYASSTDQTPIPLPITDDMITEMEADALAGGVISSPCPYVINSSRSIGPIKINCDLEISGSPTVTLTGPVWVNGNIVIRNSAVIKISSGLGSQSVAIIADKSSDRLTSSSIDLSNTTTFTGSGAAGSFIFLISQNNSAELGGSEEAITMDNTSSGDVVLYAGHGLIAINNSATLKEVTGYKIRARNSANIIYDTGLANAIFNSGPGGGYEILNWSEIE